MIRLLVVLAVVSNLTSYNPQTAAKPDAVEWTPLFDGRSLTGWTPEETAQWHVAGGLIVGDAGGDGWLRSRHQFRDFAMKHDYRNSLQHHRGNKIEFRNIRVKTL